MHRSTAIILSDIHPYEYVIVYISTFLNTAWQEHTKLVLIWYNTYKAQLSGYNTIKNKTWNSNA